MKSTKKALLLSMMSMLLCVAMLIGTTYAWFTDSVTSGTNRIVAGNLDVDMLYKSGNMTEYQTVNGVANTEDGSTPFFVDKDGGKILWEPGVMVYTYFDVENLGTLALRYNFALRITEKNALMTGDIKHSLDEVIKAVVLPGEVAGNQVKSSVEGKEWKSIETFTDADSLKPNDNKKFTVVLYWAPTANDDLYNVKNGQTTTNVGAWTNNNTKALYINFDIRLTATQLDHENDSFDNTYDKFADLWKLSTVTPDGRWVGITKGESCILDGTLDPYITVVGADGQPGEIIALTDGLSKSVGDGTITVSGNNVTYTNSGAAQEVVIRTGSLETELTVNAPKDVVKHYDTAGAVNIIEAHTASYHEYGKVPFVEIAKGRIALEEGAEVEKLHFDATTAKDFEQIIVAAAPSVTLPEFSRDEAVIKENGTLVVELQKDTNNDSDTKSDYVWLYKQGVISQIVVANENIVGIEKDATTGDLKGAIKESSEYETLQLGVTTKAQETQKAAVEIANNYTGSHGTTQTVGGKEDVNVAELDENGDIKVEEGKSLEETVAEVINEGGKDGVEIKKEVIFNKVLNFVSTIDTLGCGETYKFKTTLDSKDIVWDCDCDYDIWDYSSFSNGEFTTLYHSFTVTIKATLGSRTISHDVYITPYHAGTGTEDDHIEIINYTQYSNLLRGDRRIKSDNSCYIYSIGKYDGNFDPTGEKTYIDFVDDIDFNWTNPLQDSYSSSNRLYCYNLVVDGKGHKIDHAYGALFSPYRENNAYRFGDFTVKNLTLNNFVGTYYGNAFGYCGSYENGGTFTFEEVNVNFSPEYYSKDSTDWVSYYGSMLGAIYDSPVIFRNCNVTNAHVYGSSYWAGGFVGNGQNVIIDSCSYDGIVEVDSGNAAGFIGHAYGKDEINNCQIMPGTIIKNRAAGGSVQAFGLAPTLKNNRFYGSLVCDTKTKATQAEDAWSKSEPSLPANSFVIDENRNITYVGTEQIAKVKVTYSYAIDRLMTTLNPVRFDGYMPSTVYSKEFENVTSNSQFVTIQKITNIVNVVDTEYVSKVFNATDDTSHLVAENRLGETEFYLEGTTIYVDGRGSCPAFFSGSASYSKDTGELTAKNMTSNFASITVYAYDANGELLGTNVLRYGFEIK